MTKELTTTDKLIDALTPWLAEAEGITISGGEPFDQPQALKALLQNLRDISQADILVYTGYALEDVAGWFENASHLIDALISDPYVEHAPQTLALRGSDNQRLHFLTDLGRAKFTPYDRFLCHADRHLDVMFDADGSVWFAGIPMKEDFRRLRETLTHNGHHIVLTLPNEEGASVSNAVLS
jgi:anaerobic ribonucleoside-triphosphate reductase activating protein